MRSSRWHTPVMLAVFLAFLSGFIQANEEIAVLGLQHAKCLCGVVTVNGVPVQYAKVEEFGPDWKGTLRSTDTDSEGRFTLAPVKGQLVYYLQVSTRGTGVNPLRVPVEIGRFRGVKFLHLQLHLA
jgi:hypothetical protein